MGLITGTTAFTVRVTGAVPGPVGFETVAVETMFHWSAQPAPAAELSSVPDHCTDPVG
jgi:hypothetical protein